MKRNKWSFPSNQVVSKIRYSIMKELLLENLSNRAQQYINRHLDEFSVDYYEDKPVNAPDIVNFIQSFQEQMNFERAIREDFKTLPEQQQKEIKSFLRGQIKKIERKSMPYKYLIDLCVVGLVLFSGFLKTSSVLTISLVVVCALLIIGWSWQKLRHLNARRKKYVDFLGAVL